MDYLAFLLVNANLFLRPAELVPALERLPLYFWFMFACLIVSVPRLLGLLSAQSPLRHPSALCVFGVAVLIAVAHLVNSDFERTADESIEFIKVVVYFVLFLAVVSTSEKLRFMVACVILFGLATTLVGVLEFHQWIDLPNLRVHSDELFRSEGTGELLRRERLMLTGILHDPNEFCVFLGVLSLFTLYELTNRSQGVLRFLWIAPLGLFLYGIHLTQSRGGLLAFVAGLGTYAICRWGLRRALVAGAVALPTLFLALVLSGGDRQTSISITQDTGRARLELWSDWMMKFRGSPLIGEGPKMTDKTLAERKRLAWDFSQVAHNSYLQAFADLGVGGGMLFLGAFVFAFRSLSQLRSAPVTILDPELRRLYPFLFGALAAYMMGMMSLSMNYVLPTYFILALTLCFAHLAVTEPRVEPVTFNGAALRQVALASVGMLGFIFLLIKVLRV